MRRRERKQTLKKTKKLEIIIDSNFVGRGHINIEVFFTSNLITNGDHFLASIARYSWFSYELMFSIVSLLRIAWKTISFSPIKCCLSNVPHNILGTSNHLFEFQFFRVFSTPFFEKQSSPPPRTTDRPSCLF